MDRGRGLQCHLHPNENQGGDMQRLGPMDDFNDMMSDTGLIDAGFEGERSPGPTKEFGEDLTESFILRSGLKHLTSLELCTYLEDSDHHPLCIEATKAENKKPSSFRFQNMWLHHQSFLQTVKQSWELPIEGYGMYKLQQKIYRTKELLKKWNRETFGNVFTTVQQAKQEATDAEKKFDRDPSEANLIALNKSNAVMVHALTLEAEYWKQKSNCKWLEAGERNTKYFHSLVKKKRVKSTIHRIMEGNQEITSPDRIRDSAASYFENLLSGQVTQSSATDFPFQFPKIPEAIGNNLCLIPTEEDIKETVFSIDKESVAGPDGFSSAFYQACWEFIARDIYDAVRDFFSGTPMPRSFTATTIVLIPKVDSPQTWNDFRPISLCNVTNKILSKLLYRGSHKPSRN
ncbi:UNVERIFIED_CONTAM: LINE-1 reverse transcriptase [Sesamum latifolium]|uniref:LINE-1 reverse transcriptase n=1 Tax=Sesamum latifolium TaxID=2727402 RepID=A0AAW2S275_9LAMI